MILHESNHQTWKKVKFPIAENYNLNIFLKKNREEMQKGKIAIS